MSTDQPLQSDPHRDRPTNEYTSDRDRSYPGDVARLNGHELVAIDEWLPGAEPTPYELNLTDGYEYRTRYWRCRKCGQERNHRDEFTVPCNNPQPATALEAGGYSIDGPRTRRALNEKLDVRFATVGPLYEVRSESGNTYDVDISRQQRVPVLISSSASQMTAVSIFAVSTSRSARGLFLRQMVRSAADCRVISSLETVCIPGRVRGSKGVHRSNP